jgi:aminopeptidase N
MLRFVVGEDAFWKILKKYASDYAYSCASTEDFRAVCEQVHEGELGWFFDQWIYQAGYPICELGWGYSPSQKKVNVVITQIQEEFPLFEMPVDIEVKLPSGLVKKRVWIKEKNNAFDFSVTEKPLEVLFDPDGWLLFKRQDFRKKGHRKR